VFYIGGMCKENVDKWLHLGRVISNDGDDMRDIVQRRCKFMGQFNSVLCWFGKLDSTSKIRLLKSYCFDFYGCELWDLANVDIQYVYILALCIT